VAEADTASGFPLMARGSGVIGLTAWFTRRFAIPPIIRGRNCFGG
jgi:hypothetical protein